MCGIAGIFNTNGKPVSVSLLRKMTDSIAHRGPDGEGFWTDSFVGLGHRRLAIIDLTPAGHQPMQTESGKFTISYNGEIYNYLNIRTELEAIGYQFHSNTDTEVVLKAFEEWGLDSIERLNGMFAFAIWSKDSNELTLVRDRYGVKPLYYYHKDGIFLFASEIKAFMQHPTFQVNVNQKAVMEYFSFQNIFSDLTLFDGVKVLKPGSFMKIKLGQSYAHEEKKYWDFNFEPDNSMKKDEIQNLVAEKFEGAVQSQLLADVELGSYLSGGMDSGSVVAVAARNISNLKTFTCGFDLSSASGLELNYDERQRAEFLSQKYRTEQYEIVLKAGDMERVMPNLIWHLEDLRIGQSYPNYYVARLAGKFVKAALCGTGGDEIFAGYPWRYYKSLNETTPSSFLSSNFEFWQRLVPAEFRSTFFNPSFIKENPQEYTFEVFKNIYKPMSTSDFQDPRYRANQSLYFEAKTFLHGLLVVEDKLSMAHGLETRVPFLDNNLVDLALKIPIEYKLQNFGQQSPGADPFRASDGKLILRKALAELLPSEYVTGVKQGFSAPDASWFRGDSINYVKEIICDPKARMFDYLDFQTVKKLTDQHFEAKENRRLLIWSLLCFEWWNRIFNK